jgi:mannose-6-phosphate isomerase
MLHGFRRVSDIARIWSEHSELKRAAGPTLMSLICSATTPDDEHHVLRRLYEQTMTLEQQEVDRCFNDLVARLQPRPYRKDEPEFWFLRAAHEFDRPDNSRDRGLFAFFLLNLLRLEAGEATFQGPGVLHAYLEGQNVELMANSDNVLRGGLTQKHVNVPELLRIVRFDAAAPTLINSRRISPTEVVFPTSAEEFELGRIEVASGLVHTRQRRHAPDCLVVMEGGVNLAAENNCLRLTRGGIVLVPFGVAYQIETQHQRAVLFRASLPETNV